MKMTYWISTTILCLFLLTSAYTYLFHKTTIDGVKALGFPKFFIIQLAILKLIAVIIIALPYAPVQFKEWAYAGVMLFLITALVAHIAHKDSIGISVLLVILMSVTAISYYTLNRIAN